jgi:hypothetical protein
MFFGVYFADRETTIDAHKEHQRESRISPAITLQRYCFYPETTNFGWKILNIE